MSWPKPKVARARNRPDSRSAGMAMATPSGTTTQPGEGEGERNGTPRVDEVDVGERARADEAGLGRARSAPTCR